MSIISVNETVISGTFNSRDLIPTFINLVSEIIDGMAMDHGDRFKTMYARYTEELGDMERNAYSPTYYELDECYHDLERLFDMLDELAPSGHYFGSHPGNGADFGFWPCEEED